MNKARKSLIVFYIIIATYYSAIILIGYYGVLRLGIQAFISFLEIAIAPTVPAFVAIYLSLYTVQARAARESQKLASIQIQELIRNARKEHYEKVSEQLNALLKEINVNDLVIRKDNSTIDCSNFLLGKISIEKVKEDNFKFARLHLNSDLRRDGKEELEKYLNSAGEADNLNDKMEQLKIEIKQQILEISNRVKGTQVSDNIDTVKSGANISKLQAASAICKIWTSDKENNDVVVESINKILNGGIPAKGTSLGEIQLESILVLYASTPIARTDGYPSGLNVLKVILGVLEDRDLRKNFLDTAERIYRIKEHYKEISDEVTKITEEISKGLYTGTAECCPYMEYKD